MNAYDISAVGLNPEIQPHLEIWGWEIAVYLFLGGLAAGLMVLSGFAHRRGKTVSTWGLMLAPVILSAGMFALFLDLEHKLQVWRFYTTFQWRSPMSWGSWILALVYPASLAFIAAVRWDLPFRRWMASANIVLGAALGVYTGILLGAFGARPLWNSPMLGPLFLASGLSSAAALLYLLEPAGESKDEIGRLDAKFLAAEALLLALFFLGLATGGEAQRSAASLFFGGAYTAVFWIGVIFLGMLAPLALERLAKSGRGQHTIWPQALVLAGGLALRTVIVLAGQASHWELL